MDQAEQPVDNQSRPNLPAPRNLNPHCGDKSPIERSAIAASFRNLANGIYELQKQRGKTCVDTLKSWCQQQTFSTVWPILQR